MAAKDDETTGFCCCALIVVAVVITVIGWIVDFVGSHPVWTAVIVLTLIGLAILVVIGAQSDSAAGSTQRDGKEERTSGSPSRPQSGRPLAAHAQEGHSLASEITGRPAAHRHLRDSMGPPDAWRTEEAVQPTSLDSRNIDAHSLSAADSHPDSTIAEAEQGVIPGPIMTPNEFRAIAKTLLRRDLWAILGASFTSARGGIDMVAARGTTIIAVQCHAATGDGALDGPTAQHLLSAPFDVHRIEEVVLLSSAPISAAAENVAASHEKRIHLIGGSEFLEWREGHRRLEPTWGLITPTQL